MTIINPNSISGISSITALNSTAAINLFKADGTSANIIAGVTTGSNFITGTSNVHSTGYECTNINASGIITATSFSGDGSSLSNLPAGAPVGGASTNTVFFENDKAVAVNYQITSTKNAMSAGPIAINAGIAVTVPSGCSWTIV